MTELPEDVLPEGAPEVVAQDGSASRDVPMPQHLQDAIARDWDPAPPMPHPARPDGASYTPKRRSALSAHHTGQLVLVPAGNYRVRANDTDYAFRASSPFTWLTGETIADAVLALEPVGAGHEATLFVREYTQPGEVEYFTSRTHGAVWVGNVPSVDETADALDIHTRPLGDLDAVLARHGSADTVLLRGHDSDLDAKLPTSSGDQLRETLDELRLVKDDWELARLREACEATGRGFSDVVRELRAVVGRTDIRGERWLEGTFWRRARMEGNDVGYTSILGSGRHATTLHWWRNHGVIEPGSLLLADMGVETDELYTADVTRTMPVSGEWTPEQLTVYRAVYEAQQAGIAEVHAGADFLAAHRAAMWVLADHLHSWGIIPVTADVACDPDPEKPDAGLHRRYTLHSTSHMLGLDVHDCAAARNESYRDATLVAGNVLTVEPGLYFQVNDRTVPPELRGIGVRIEDDIAVTDDDPVNLSDSLPSDPAGVLEWMRAAQGSPADP